MGKGSPPELGNVTKPRLICKKLMPYPNINPIKIPFPAINNPSKRKIERIVWLFAPKLISVCTLFFFSTNNMVSEAIKLNEARIKMKIRIIKTINFSDLLV
jgi:hypothetical protein